MSAFTPGVNSENFPSLHVSYHQELCIATLNCPQNRNALNASLLEQLNQLIDRLQQRSCKVLLLMAEGEYFCAGMDLAEINQNDISSAKKLNRFSELLQRFHHANFLSVCYVKGHAIGGGCALACACDLVYHGQQALFQFPEMLFGLVPAMAWEFIARRTGQQTMFRLAVTSGAIGTDKAQELGLSDGMFPSENDVFRQCCQWRKRLSLPSLKALKALRKHYCAEPEQHFSFSSQLLADRLNDKTVQQGIKDYLEEGKLPWLN
ncbi:putative Enoyl-CoA hydratase [Xenorhabdus nematophila ATCC 19061]|uniref:Enoyl-CoA hydratase n=1 Tax=Xenorhabdus nematophila (strain ATCC 19061 / DSM 3370 / CCUG 14189 / LMG 1036 / NCIMB 9965 / AN6) TaxID=406817 RepID=D3VCW0_XENNA|nr:enoyl-CoA hydratase/isomerase family protein [Xenorhabdus nematophila]CBJ89826.1 putative Enoyl-CoA hydratase [Xenorhabdus nematophila ATCC 19061]CEK22711.1 putative Enoyl-CoA hydratase [Xenorhabdus nematophila AN6/1]